jgi:ribonuclease P protein component
MLRFPKSAKILRSADFRAVYDQSRDHGFRVSNSLFAAFCLPHPAGETRVGVTTTKALGGAVVRNRIKRRIREIYRLHRPEIAAGWDVVINPRRPAIGVPFADLERAFMKVMERCKSAAQSPKPQSLKQ